MEESIKKAGRPVVPVDKRKKARALSLTDAEHAVLEKLAEARGLGISKYVIERLNLS